MIGLQRHIKNQMDSNIKLGDSYGFLTGNGLSERINNLLARFDASENYVRFKDNLTEQELSKVVEWLNHNTTERTITRPEFIRKYKDGRKERQQTG